MEVAMRMMRIRFWVRNICFLFLAIILTTVILLVSVPLNIVVDDQTMYEVDHTQRNIVLFVLVFTSLSVFPYLVYHIKRIRPMIKILKIKKKEGE
jgi:hypothetical protein